MRSRVLTKIGIASVLMLANRNTLTAQKIDPVIKRHLGEIRSLYKGNLLTGKRYITNYMFDSLITEKQSKISGTFLKDGKTVATTASLDDKSITVNHNVARLWERLYLQATARGNSTDDLVDIFSQGKYKRELSGGVNFNFFPRINSASHFLTSKWRLWNQLQAQDICFQSNEQAIVGSYSSLLDSLEFIYRHCANLLCTQRNFAIDAPGYIPSDDKVNCDSCSLNMVIKFNQIISRLSNYYSKDLNPAICDSDSLFIHWIDEMQNNHKQIATDLAERENLHILDSLQRQAQWTHFRYTWFTGGIKVNEAANPIFDEDAGDNVYTRNYTDVFLSTFFSFNYMSVNPIKKNISYFSPTVSFDNSRDFLKDSLLNIQSQQKFITKHGDTLQIVNSTSFYRQLAQRVNHFSVELPYVLYFSQSHSGLDLAAGIKFSLSESPKDIYGRIGYYLPISTGDDDFVTIEPILRFDKLNLPHLIFLKDMVSFGFNISVSLPKFLTE